MHRRAFLTGLAAAAAAACPMCQALAGEAKHIVWGYGGINGPDRWGALSPEYTACQSGTQQSPIDLIGAVRAELPSLELAYGKVPAHIQDNGHTLEMPIPAGHELRLDGADYELLQIHFHAPSEHRIDGRTFPMEAHFVHRSSAGDLAVVGVMLAEGQQDEGYAPLFHAMASTGVVSNDGSGDEIDLARLLPGARDYYRYAGSLTTPDCSENVTWIVLREPVTATAAQIARFTARYPLNSRPVQPAHRRFVLRSF